MTYTASISSRSASFRHVAVAEHILHRCAEPLGKLTPLCRITGHEPSKAAILGFGERGDNLLGGKIANSNNRNPYAVFRGKRLAIVRLGDGTGLCRGSRLGVRGKDGRGGEGSRPGNNQLATGSEIQDS